MAVHAGQNVEWTLNSFDLASDSLALVAVPLDKPWAVLPQLAAQFPGTLIAGVFAPLMQLERSFSMAQHRANIPSLCLSPERGSLLRTLAKELPLGAIVSLWSDRESLRDVLESSELASVHKRYVLAPHERPGLGIPNASFEIHSMPGVVSLWQCAALAGGDSFHPSEDFARLPEAGLAGTEVPCACGEMTRITT